ncbi:MAG: hypothetical protein ACLP2X_11500 [Syntrophobacteraceae bacterium]
MTAKRLSEKGTRRCPECGHLFKGYGYDGIDAHWRGKKQGHEHIMPYEKAWELIQKGAYKRN